MELSASANRTARLAAWNSGHQLRLADAGLARSLNGNCGADVCMGGSCAMNAKAEDVIMYNISDDSNEHILSRTASLNLSKLRQAQ